MNSCKPPVCAQKHMSSPTVPNSIPLANPGKPVWESLRSRETFLNRSLLRAEQRVRQPYQSTGELSSCWNLPGYTDSTSIRYMKPSGIQRLPTITMRPDGLQCSASAAPVAPQGEPVDTGLMREQFRVYGSIPKWGKTAVLLPETSLRSGSLAETPEENPQSHWATTSEAPRDTRHECARFANGRCFSCGGYCATGIR